MFHTCDKCVCVELHDFVIEVYILHMFYILEHVYYTCICCTVIICISTHLIHLLCKMPHMYYRWRTTVCGHLDHKTNIKVYFEHVLQIIFALSVLANEEKKLLSILKMQHHKCKISHKYHISHKVY